MHRTTELREMDDFEKLIRKTGLSSRRSNSIFHQGESGYCKASDLYRMAIEECCFREKLGALKDLLAFVYAHLNERRGVVKIGRIRFDYILRPIEIAVGLTVQLYNRRHLSLLPSFMQAIIDYSIINDNSMYDGSECRIHLFAFSPLFAFMKQVVELLEKGDVLTADEHEVVLHTTRLLLSTRKEHSQDEGRALILLLNHTAKWSLKSVASVGSIERHFKWFVKLVTLFIENPVAAERNHTLTILSAAEDIIESHYLLTKTTTDFCEDIHVAKMNAILDGLADVFRCFLLVRAHAFMARHLYDENYFLCTLSSRLVLIADYSSRSKCSSKLFDMIIDTISDTHLNQVMDMLYVDIRDTKKESTPDLSDLEPGLRRLHEFLGGIGEFERMSFDVLRACKVKALKYLEGVEIPRSLRYLSRRAIHRAVWEKELPDGTRHERLDAELSTLKMPEIVLNYCLYS